MNEALFNTIDRLSEIIHNLASERDEARRWARNMKFQRDTQQMNFEHYRALYEGQKAENNAMRRELEELYILIEAKQQELDLRPIIYLYAEPSPEYRTITSDKTELPED